MKRRLCFLLLWLAALLTWGQNSQTVLDMRSGLPENRIRAICQMTDGRMAIATTATIEVYDGTRFRSYTLPPKLAFPLPDYHGTRQLTCDSTGHIFLRNNQTLYVVDTRRGEVMGDVGSLLRQQGLTERDVAAWPTSPTYGGDTTALAHDCYGGTWIGTKEKGILYDNARRSRQFVTTADSFAFRRLPNFVSPRASQLSARYAPSATNCTLDTDDYTYLGTREGVLIIRAVKGASQGESHADTLVATIGEAYGLLTNNIAAMQADHLGDVWIATAGGGLTRLHVAGADSFSIVNYGLPDGIRTEGREFRTCQIHRDTASGLFTVGFVGGTVMFHPDSVTAPRYTFHYPTADTAMEDDVQTGTSYWWLWLIVLAAAMAALLWVRLRRTRPDKTPVAVRNTADVSQTVDNAVRKATSAETGPTADDLFIEKLQKTIVQHLGDEDFSVQQLGDLMAMDRTVLYRRMQQLNLGAPSAYIKQIRMQVAERLLRETDMSVSDIAMKTGFSTTKYFSAAFKDIHGKSPKSFRDEMVNN